jgi:hypothetical protein
MEKVNYVHNIIEPKLNSFIVPVLLTVLFLLIFIACIGVMYYMKNTTIHITNGFLTIKAFFYGKSIPLDNINVNGIRKLNLYHDDEYNIKIRSNGIGLPNYYTGWMKLNNGNKALVYLTDRKKVILIPTKEYDILFSTDDFDGIKDTLNETIN